MLQVETSASNYMPQNQKLKKRYSKIKVNNNNKFDIRKQICASLYFKRMFQFSIRSRKTFVAVNAININHFRGSE